MWERMSAWCCHNTLGLLKKGVRLLSLDLKLIGGLLIMVSEQSVQRDRLAPREDLHDWCSLYEVRILCVSTSQLSRKNTHTAPDDKWELVEMRSLKYWIPVDLHTVYGSMNRKYFLIIQFFNVWDLRRWQLLFACMWNTAGSGICVSSSFTLTQSYSD